ncbi:DksA/TraR family C4-type zinc finger protein [Moraxella osloensis]|uniref:DksA/TraR family C4-type zinc finger protein n=1 Tax=Faucicola osloensis TaxID=34062 RepID=A0A6P1KPS4_FAUOS|nr:DksA/TraR family C4-type zinc finger protein [Moraxella osloensis]QHG10435.1 DksA/TraR family C4-type zinc finger protein [Moraxella osloensis]
MASGWAADGAENEQIEATINDAIERAKRALPQGESLTHCEECDAPIPETRRLAMPGVRLCVRCQQSLEQHQQKVELFNRRGSKDSQLR